MNDVKGPVVVAVIGSGSISDEYLTNLVTFPDLEIRWVAGRNIDSAQAKANKFGIPRWGQVSDAISDPQVELVLDLTIPSAHAEIAELALRAGKHVWAEKPIATYLEDARNNLKLAESKSLHLCVAPDTILGQAVHSAFDALNRGEIGRPLFFDAGFAWPGPEKWHPNPAFLYDHGAGPLFDIGPYFIATLVCLLGSVKSVNAIALQASESRTIETGDLAGTTFPVLVPTTVLANLEFKSGAIGRIKLSFDGMVGYETSFELTGTDASLIGDGELLFSAPMRLQKRGEKETTAIPTSRTPFLRGMGLVDLARSIRRNETPRTNGATALHVLDVLYGVDESIKRATRVDISTNCPDFTPLPEGWNPREFTLGAKEGS